MYLQSRIRLIDPNNLKSKRGFDLANRVRVEGEWRGWKRKGREHLPERGQVIGPETFDHKKKNLAEIAEKKRVRVTKEERLSTKHSHHQSTSKLIAKPRPWNSESNDAQEEGAGGGGRQKKWGKNHSYGMYLETQSQLQSKQRFSGRLPTSGLGRKARELVTGSVIQRLESYTSYGTLNREFSHKAGTGLNRSHPSKLLCLIFIRPTLFRLTILHLAG